MAHISQNEFEKSNWLPISDRIRQSALSTTVKFVNDIGSNYINEVFHWAIESNRNLRRDYGKLKQPFLQPRSTQKLNNIHLFKNYLKNFIRHNLLIK